MFRYLMILDNVLNTVTAGGVGGSAAAPAAATAPASGILYVGGGQIDTAFLDALYTGAKVTAAQRDAIMAGSDPSAVGLNAYDLYYLTVGRLGSRVAAAVGFPIIAIYSASTVYQAGQIVIFQPPGTVQVGLYQAGINVPVGTAPTVVAYWTQLSSPQAAPIAIFNGTTAYQANTLVAFQPPGTQNLGLYQALVAPPVGTLPSVLNVLAEPDQPRPHRASRRRYCIARSRGRRSRGRRHSQPAEHQRYRPGTDHHPARPTLPALGFRYPPQHRGRLHPDRLSPSCRAAGFRGA